jgi:hypothetical protein
MMAKAGMMTLCQMSQDNYKQIKLILAQNYLKIALIGFVTRVT